MSGTVECPYCGKDNDMRDGLTDLPSDNKFDHECEHCEKEFEVFVEFVPYFSSDEIIFEKCDGCGEETREIRRRKRVYPFPDHLKGDTFCHSCYMQGMKEVYDKKFPLNGSKS